MKKLDAYLTEAIDNIREDREVTKELLSDIMQYMAQDQLVKVSSIIHKQESASGNTGLSDEDKDDLFDLIKQEEQ